MKVRGEGIVLSEVNFLIVKTFAREKMHTQRAARGNTIRRNQMREKKYVSESGGAGLELRMLELAEYLLHKTPELRMEPPSKREQRHLAAGKQVELSLHVVLSEHLWSNMVRGRSLWGLLGKRKQKTQAKHPF